MSSSVALLIFEKWKADLAKKDRSHLRIQDNFGELFSDLYSNRVTFEEAHSILQLAIKAHLPTDYIARRTYKAFKSKFDKSEREFIDDWKELINNTGIKAFYDFYSLNQATPEDKKAITDNIVANDGGRIVTKDYVMQQAYADAYPEVDVEKAKNQIEHNIAEFEQQMQQILAKIEKGTDE